MNAKAINETRQPFLWATYPSRLRFRELARATLSRFGIHQTRNGIYMVLHQAGFLLSRYNQRPHRDRLRDHRHYWRCGGLLHHLFTFLLISSCEETRMCVFCDTFRFCKILLAEPSLSKSDADCTASDRHARHLALWCSDFPPNSIGDEKERLPDAPASASGTNVQLSQHHSQSYLKCNDKTIFKWSIISSCRYRGLLIHLLPGFPRAVHA